MAMQRLLLSEDDLSDADIIHMLTEETTFGGNNYNQPISNKLTMQNLNTYSNGQIGLSHIMTKYQKTQGSSHDNGRVTQPMNSHGVEVTEIVRDHVITISSRERVSISNQHVAFPIQPVFENIDHGVIHQTPIEDPRSSTFNNISGFQSKHNFGGTTNSSHVHMHSHETNDQVIHPNFQPNCNSRGLEFPTNKAAPLLKHPVMDHRPKVDEYQEQKNHAPYMCTKCGERFITTQCYGTHVMAHYQYEKIAERVKRKESKCREKLLLAQSNNEVRSEGHRSKKPKKTVKTEAVVKKE